MAESISILTNAGTIDKVCFDVCAIDDIDERWALEIIYAGRVCVPRRLALMRKNARNIATTHGDEVCRDFGSLRILAA